MRQLLLEKKVIKEKGEKTERNTTPTLSCDASHSSIVSFTFCSKNNRIGSLNFTLHCGQVADSFFHLEML